MNIEGNPSKPVSDVPQGKTFILGGNVYLRGSVQGDGTIRIVKLLDGDDSATILGSTQVVEYPFKVVAE